MFVGCTSLDGFLQQYGDQWWRMGYHLWDVYFRVVPWAPEAGKSSHFVAIQWTYHNIDPFPPYSFGRTAPNETMMDVDEITSGPQNGAVLFFWGGWVLNWKNRRRVQRFQIWAFNGSWFSLDPSPRSETRELPGEHVMTFTVGFAFRGEHEINLQPQIMYRSTHFRRLQYNIRFCQGSLTN